MSLRTASFAIVAAIALLSPSFAGDDGGTKGSGDGKMHPKTGSQLYRVINVNPKDQLAMLSGPRSRESEVGVITPGAEVKINKCQVVAGYSRQWCLVSYLGTTGWVNSYYLERR